MAIDLGGWGWAADLAIDYGLPALGMAFGVPGPATAYAGKLLRKALGLAPNTSDATVQSSLEGLDSETQKTILEGVQSEVTAKYAYLTAAVEAAARVSQTNITETNKTQRAELGKVSWWHWRHLIGYVLVLMGFELCMMIPLVAVGKISAADLAAIVAAMTPVTVVFAGLLGYVAQDTTNQKIAAVTGEKPDGIIVATAKALGRKK